MGNLCNCLTKLLIKDRIKNEIMHLLYKIINNNDDDDGNKRLMKLKKSNVCCTGYVE